MICRTWLKLSDCQRNCHSWCINHWLQLFRTITCQSQLWATFSISSTSTIFSLGFPHDSPRLFSTASIFCQSLNVTGVIPASFSPIMYTQTHNTHAMHTFLSIWSSGYSGKSEVRNCTQAQGYTTGSCGPWAFLWNLRSENTLDLNIRRCRNCVSCHQRCRNCVATNGAGTVFPATNGAGTVLPPTVRELCSPATNGAGTVSPATNGTGTVFLCHQRHFNHWFGRFKNFATLHYSLQFSMLLSLNTLRVRKKLDHFHLSITFGKYCPILIILSLLQTDIHYLRPSVP